MTSRSKQHECYVYITLPGQVGPVTAGKLVIDVDRYQNPLGKFIYGKRYLERQDAVDIDPVELKLSGRIFETTKLKGIFGALRDASPDYWGRRVIERHCGKAQLNELDYLLFAPDDHAGALGFGLNQVPPAPKRVFNRTIDLVKLQQVADNIIKEEILPTDSVVPQIEDLMLLETSMGGARPKVVVEDDIGLWIAKFNRPDDNWNQARVEHAMLVLARCCGLSVAESKVVDVGGRDVLLVKRFDRERTISGYLRSRMISALTILGAEDTYLSRERCSYLSLAEELRRISAEPTQDVAELFRRMCFNALISNLDDHPRNHAVIAKEQDWRLSPAYDLTPTVPISIERRYLAMTCGDAGCFANATNLLSQHGRFLLEPDEAKTILNKMQRYIKNKWYRTARSEGVSEKDCAKISTAFVYPGFNR